MPKYFRLPDGFISIANLTIISKPSISRCSPSLISSQTLANLSKSFCLDDISGFARKCGITVDTNSPRFLTSNLIVLSDRPGRMDPQFHFIFDHVEKLSSIGVLADREIRPNLPAQAMTFARLE